MTLKDRTDLPEAVQKAIEEYERIKDDPNLQMEALNLEYQDQVTIDGLVLK